MNQEEELKLPTFEEQISHQQEPLKEEKKKHKKKTKNHSKDHNQNKAQQQQQQQQQQPQHKQEEPKKKEEPIVMEILQDQLMTNNKEGEQKTEENILPLPQKEQVKEQIKEPLKESIKEKAKDPIKDPRKEQIKEKDNNDNQNDPDLHLKQDIENLFISINVLKEGGNINFDKINFSNAELSYNQALDKLNKFALPKTLSTHSQISIDFQRNKKECSKQLKNFLSITLERQNKFREAIVIIKDLIDNYDFNTNDIYSRLLHCFIEIKDLTKANELVETIKRRASDLGIFSDLFDELNQINQVNNGNSIKDNACFLLDKAVSYLPFIILTVSVLAGASYFYYKK